MLPIQTTSLEGVSLRTQMSALGQKQTDAVQNAMSALPPIANAKADIRKRPCPLYHQKRTCAAHTLLSALSQKRTLRDLSGMSAKWCITPHTSYRGRPRSN